jgi:hypothetical protein
MKKNTSSIFSLLLLGLFLSINAFGNLDNYSVYGGLSMSGASNPDVQYNSRTGGMIGVGMNFNFNNQWGFSPEVSLVEKGVKSSDGTVTYKMPYVEVPFLFRYTMGNSRTQFSLVGGPSLGLVISPKISTEGAADTPLPNYTNNELCILAGGQLSHWFTSTIGLFLSARYSSGLTNISATTGSYYSRSFYLFAGVSFRDKGIDFDLENRAQDYLQHRQETHSH